MILILQLIDERKYRKLQFLQNCSTHPAANLLWTKKETAMTIKVIVCAPELQFFSLKLMITTYQIWPVLLLRSIVKYLFLHYYIYSYIINLYI